MVCGMEYPGKLAEIVGLFEALPEAERRDLLVSYAGQAGRHEPRDGDNPVIRDVRKDEECTDEVGVFLDVDADDRVRFRMTLGPQVQTLTKAMTAILCTGLEGATPRQVLDLPSDFVPRLIGAQLVRARSQTVYYVLTRMKSVCKVYLDRRRAGTGDS